MKRARGSVLLAGLGTAVVLLASPLAAREVPFLSGRIVDEAELVPPEIEARLTLRLEALEKETGAQVAVLTVESLEGEALEDFSLRVVETWKLGRAEADDGVLFLVARDDRKMRIEVGYGLEPVLTDLESGRILDELVRPRFRDGDFAGGIETGLDAIQGSIRGEELPAPPAGGSDGNALTAKVVMMVLFVVVVGTFSLIALFTKGCQTWFLYVFLMPFWAAFPSVIHPRVGLTAFLLWAIGFPLLKRFLTVSPRGKRFLESHPGWTTFASSGRGGGGWSSGGGFSGGGGSFGGGGASSGW